MTITGSIKKSLKKVLLKEAEEFQFTEDMFDDVGKGLIFKGFGKAKVPEEVEIPEKFNDKEVFAIGMGAFSYKHVKKVIIPKTVTEIHDKAFDNCVKLETVEGLSDSIKSIGRNAFYNCQSLKEINLPKSLESISDECFLYCTSLKEVKIPNSVKKIGTYAFTDCISLKSVDIPSASVIHLKAFMGCHRLETINIGSVAEIRKSAFSGCSNLKEVKFPKTLKKIEDYAFSQCKSLKEITIPDSVSIIGRGAFEECSSLNSIDLPSNVNVGDGAFNRCNELEKVNGIKMPEVIINMIIGTRTDTKNVSTEE